MSTLLGVLPATQVVLVLDGPTAGPDGPWFKIASSGMTGWTSSQYLNVVIKPDAHALTGEKLTVACLSSAPVAMPTPPDPPLTLRALTPTQLHEPSEPPSLEVNPHSTTRSLGTAAGVISSTSTGTESATPVVTSTADAQPGGISQLAPVAPNTALASATSTVSGPPPAESTPSMAIPVDTSLQVGGQARVVSDGGLNLRSTPGMTGSIVSLVGAMRYVRVVAGPESAADGQWFQVDHDGETGWVAAPYLRAAAELEFTAAREQREGSARDRASVTSRGGKRGSDVGAEILRLAQTLLGSPYTWGGTNPRTGFDCSGFVWYVMKHIGVDPGRTTNDQAGGGTHIARNDLQPGDVVLFANTYERGYSHNGIYLGSGRFVHSEDYKTGVIVSSINDGYWGGQYAGARRFR